MHRLRCSGIFNVRDRAVIFVKCGVSNKTFLLLSLIWNTWPMTSFFKNLTLFISLYIIYNFLTILRERAFWFLYILWLSQSIIDQHTVNTYRMQCFSPNIALTHNTVYLMSITDNNNESKRQRKRSEKQKTKRDNTQTPPKTSITQRLRTD